MSKLQKWQIGATAFCLVIGTILHFTYELSGGNTFVAAFSAVNESTWEHLKLVFYPTFIFSIIEYFFIGKSTNNYSIAKTTAIIFEMSFITIFFYTYTGIIGTNYAFLDISSFVVAIIAGEYITYKIMLKPQIKNNAIKILAIIISILLLIAFIIATYNPPMINLFKDPVTGGYGI